MKHKNDDDIKIAEFLKKELPEAHENMWFTQKVLNRLPEKRKSYEWIEYCVYVIGVVVCVFFMIQLFDPRVITIKMLLKCSMLLTTATLLLGAGVYRAVLKH